MGEGRVRGQKEEGFGYFWDLEHWHWNLRQRSASECYEMKMVAFHCGVNRKQTGLLALPNHQMTRTRRASEATNSTNSTRQASRFQPLIFTEEGV